VLWPSRSDGWEQDKFYSAARRPARRAVVTPRRRCRPRR